MIAKTWVRNKLLLERKGIGEKRVEAKLLAGAVGGAEEHARGGTKFMEDLAARAAGCGAVFRRYRQGRDFPLPFRNGAEDGDAFRAHRQPVTRILDVAAGIDASTSSQCCGAHLIPGVWRVGVGARSRGGIDERFGIHDWASTLPHVLELERLGVHPPGRRSDPVRDLPELRHGMHQGLHMLTIER